MSIAAIVLSLVSLGYSIFRTHPSPRVDDRVTELVVSEPITEEPAMPATMDNPTPDDIIKLARSAGDLDYFSYYYTPHSDFPYSIAVVYRGEGFNRIDIDGLNTSHLYFKLNQALKTSGKLK